MSPSSGRSSGSRKPCVFCEILAGRQSAHVVLDDDVAMAFLDVRPLFPGHTLLVPREHHETLTDLPVALVEPYFVRAQRLAAVMEAPAGMGAAGSFVAMNNRISQSVPHLHVHVVPRTKGDGLKGFFWPRTKYASDDEAQSFADAVKSAWK